MISKVREPDRTPLSSEEELVITDTRGVLITILRV